MASSTAIQCTACGQESWVLREPLYEGFTKVGETFVCAACGHVYASEDDVPYVVSRGPALFTEADRTPAPAVFAEDEQKRLCRYCRHYVVNPFTQWCGVHKREVEATDTCDQFSLREGAERSD